jgi:uncharacterized membrane protein YqhA
MICKSVMVGFVQKALENLLSSVSSLIHLCMLSNVWTMSLFPLFSNFLKNLLKFQIGPLYG